MKTGKPRGRPPRATSEEKSRRVEAIRKAIKLTGLTNYEACERFGISKRTLGYWLSGIYIPSYDAYTKARIIIKVRETMPDE